MQSSLREIAFDTETTGLDPEVGHRIVEIGCVEMIDHVRTGRVFHSYLNPERAMPREAQAIHGLSDAMLADKPRFREVAEAFLAFVGDSPLVIHNAAFDMKFINHELFLADQPRIDVARAIDTLVMAKKKFPGQPNSLDALCRRYNVDLSARTKHGALLDAELLADVYLELMGGRQISLILGESEAHAALDPSPETGSGIPVPYRVFPVTEAEITRHRAFVEKLKSPLWAQFEETGS